MYRVGAARCLCLQFVAGYYFHKPAFQALRHGTSNMNVLISLGTNAAYLVLCGFDGRCRA
jgi:cation transport ATPase